jgi:hypothetical protein
MTVSTTLTFKGDLVQCTIPYTLYRAIATIQVDGGLDWDAACVKAAELMNTGSETFIRRVAEEANRLYDARFMTEVNKARATIKKKAWQEGADYVRKNEDNFHVPCSICVKPMPFSSRDGKWAEERKTLYEAYKTWYHTSCKERLDQTRLKSQPAA